MYVICVFNIIDITTLFFTYAWWRKLCIPIDTCFMSFVLMGENMGWTDGRLVLSCLYLSCLVLSSLCMSVCWFGCGIWGWEFVGVVGVWEFFFKTLYWFIIMTVVIPFHMKLCILMNTKMWMKWRGLVDRTFLYTCFSPTTRPMYRAIKRGK